MDIYKVYGHARARARRDDGMRASIDNTVVVQGRVWPLSRFMDQSRRVWGGRRKSIARGGRPGDVSLQPDDRPMRRRRRRPIFHGEQSISKDTHDIADRTAHTPVGANIR